MKEKMMFNKADYPFLNEFTNKIKEPEREIVGRDTEMKLVMAALLRPELCNVILLGEAGSGKTMLVQSISIKDSGRLYLEVDLAKMIANLNDKNEMAQKLKQLFDETTLFCKNEKKEIVLFIDEFHQIVQLSPAAVEALKPLLADSGARGIRVIAATTYSEFREYIAPNQPLVERLQRININQPDKETTIKILRGMAERYGVADQLYNNALYEMIYECTNRYIPSNSQPRKSILILDAMVGWHRLEGRRLNAKLLADVIYHSEGINVAFRVDATSIKKELDKHVFAQEFATSVIEQRLQLCVADLNDKTKPMSSFIFTGSTGVGKTEMAKQLARILFSNDRNLIRFDMSEYANPDSLRRFQIEITAAIWEHPFSILLMDEIEKSCPEVTRILLQVLDDGRLMDENGRIVSFTNCYVILTTNAGSEIYKTIAQYNADDKGSGEQIQEYNKLIRTSLTSEHGNKFPPELLGRVDAIVPFQPLSNKTQKKIVENRLAILKEEVKKKHNVDISWDKRITNYIVDENLDTESDSGGARIIMSKLETEVTTAIARYINTYPHDRKIVAVVDGKMASEHKHMLKSEAHIEIGLVTENGIVKKKY